MLHTRRVGTHVHSIVLEASIYFCQQHLVHHPIVLSGKPADCAGAREVSGF